MIINFRIQKIFKLLIIFHCFLSLFAFSKTSEIMIKASYLQLDASGSLNNIPATGYAASNVIIFAFGDVNSATMNDAYLVAMQTAIRHESPGTINLLSIGGETVYPSNINKNNISIIVNNISAQIEKYNSKLTGGKIVGVDLDLENHIEGDVISALAKAFKDKKLIVSVAPQVINLSQGSSVDPLHPTNLGLSSGGNNNQYGDAISSGYVDYIMAQTYNSGGWTIHNFQESNVSFFRAISQALNNTVQTNCSLPSTALCIPAKVKIAIGVPSNAGASGTMNNIFASNGQSSYSQTDILNQLSNEISDVLKNENHIVGVMQWSLNNDYDPKSWGDHFAVPGAFSNFIFGASAPAQLPYFILQISNTGRDIPGVSTYTTATLVVENQGAENWWIFGANAPWVSDSGMVPIAPRKNQSWGTITSAQNPNTPWVTDSNNLDNLFLNAKTSFKSNKVIINGYSSYDSNVNSPNTQVECAAGKNYIFQAGYSYNIMLDSSHGTCVITSSQTLP